MQIREDAEFADDYQSIADQITDKTKDKEGGEYNRTPLPSAYTTRTF